MKRLITVLIGAAGVAGAHAKPQLALPEVLWAAPGIECNVYFADISDSVLPGRYAWESMGPKGAQEEKRWTWTPEDADAGKSFPLTVRAFDDQGTVMEGTCTVKVAPLLDAAVKARPLVMSHLSDSLYGCGYPNALLDLMRTNSWTGYKTVGTHGGWGKKPEPNGIAYDCYGGFTWEAFLTRWMMTEQELSAIQNEAEREHFKQFVNKHLKPGGEYRLKSPFVSIVDGRKKFDIHPWMARVNGGKPPDVFLIQLGGNDVFSATDDTRAARVAAVMSHAARLLDELRKVAPRARIGVVTGTTGSSQDGFAFNYGNTYKKYNYARNIQAYNRALEKHVKDRADPLLSFVPIHQAIDPSTAWPTDERPLNSRTERTLRRDRNGLHLSPEGGRQIADVLYAWLLNHIDPTAKTRF